MKPAERYEWIERWIEARVLQRGPSVDVLNRSFVDDYVEATGAQTKVMPYGADKCPQLGRDLAAMARKGRFRRFTPGLQGLVSEGFPRWVWSYRWLGRDTPVEAGEGTSVNAS